MIQSMTGFGQSKNTLEGVDLAIEVNSVNRRNLEASVALPREWQSFERDIQAAVKERFNRGKLHLQIQASAACGEEGFCWDEAGLASSLKRLQATAEKHGIEPEVDFDTLTRLAALNKTDAVLPELEAISGDLLQLVASALDQLLDMRQTEGAALAEDILNRIDSLETHLESIGRDSGGTVNRFRELLLQRLSQAGLEIDLDDERVLKEIALFADKCDISEEITRLKSHFEQFKECVTGGSPVGRKLEFILQEVNREFNTIGSKANNMEVSRSVIEAKNEIERIREQIQNIE
ncbi:MAG: YicC/YloC family endoribonuclease [Puniceicoccaceae bacterium]